MREKSIDKWKNKHWTKHAREILNGIRKFSKNAKIGVILRHSHRYAIKSAQQGSDAGLTPMGIEFAKYFGRNLPKDRPLRLYHSIVDRCKDTAHHIHSAHRQTARNKSVEGTLKPLYDLRADGVFVTKEMMTHGSRKFLERWKNGEYSASELLPFEIYCLNAAKELWKILKNAQERCLVLFITHDLHLLSMRLGWFGMQPGEEWVSYLGGFAFSLEENHIAFFERDIINRIKYPPWAVELDNIIKYKGGE